jgi:hypothetical protein
MMIIMSLELLKAKLKIDAKDLGEQGSKPDVSAWEAERSSHLLE